MSTPSTKAPIYPRNTWYVAASATEVTDKPLGRQICGERMVFYRALEGRIAAVEDFCPPGCALVVGPRL